MFYHLKCVVKRKIKLEDYKHCLEATQLASKISHLEKYTFNVHNLQENHKWFIKSNKFILKSQQRFRSEKHNVFTEEVFTEDCIEY